jgi:uncharacterized protein
VTEQVEQTQRPPPVLTADNGFFWQAAAEGRLVGQACSTCGRLRHPPRPMCPVCGSLDWHEVTLSGDGTIYSFSILHHPQNPAFEYPVLAVLVDLDEGIRLVSNVIDTEPGDLKIGQRVHVAFVPTARDMAVPVFALTKDGAR